MSLRFIYRATTAAFIIMLAAVSFTSLTQARETRSDLMASSFDKELIIQVDGLNSKNLGQVRKNIEANPGVTFRDYCFTNHVLMYIVDRAVQTDNTFLDESLNPLNLTYQLKEGTIEQVQNACGGSPASNTEVH